MCSYLQLIWQLSHCTVVIFFCKHIEHSSLGPFSFIMPLVCVSSIICIYIFLVKLTYGLHTVFIKCLYDKADSTRPHTLNIHKIPSSNHSSPNKREYHRCSHMGIMKQQQLYLSLNSCVQLFLNSTPPLPLR